MSNPGTVVSRTGGTSSTCSIGDAALERRDRAADLAGVADGPKHGFGFRRRRHDVRRDAAADQPDRVVRLSENRIARAARSRAARRARRSACRSPTRRARETTSARHGPWRCSRTRSRPRVASPSRLSVGSPLTETGSPSAPAVRRRAPSLPRSSPTTNSRPTRVSPARAQAIGGRNLRGEDAFRVARAAPVRCDRPRGGSGRTAARNRNGWTRRPQALAERREDVEPRVVDGLLGDVKSALAQVARRASGPPRLRGRSSNRCRRARGSGRRRSTGDVPAMRLSVAEAPLRRDGTGYRRERGL